MAVASNAEKDLFLAALEKTTPAERAAFLDQACAGDAALRQRVEALLGAHEQPDSLLDQPAVPPADAVASAEPLHTQTVPASASDPPAGAGEPPPGEDSPLAYLAPPGEAGSLGRLDHYEVLEVIGRGGMGVVFKARDTKLQRLVAIKVMAIQLAASGTARQRFVREAQAAAAIRDEHVVDIHAVSDDGPFPYLVMEYIDGVTLAERIKRSGPLEVREVLRIALQTTRGLAAAHAQGLIHRDIKPANILLENGVERVKITDFGLARAADAASLTQSGVVAGTPQYMSPEQADGKPVDPRSDLFSLGSTLYAMCTGQPPFRASSTIAVLKRVCQDTPRPIRETNSGIPQWLCDIVDQLHAKNPEDRYQSAQEVSAVLAKRLAEIQLHGGVVLGPAAGSPAPRKPRRRIGAAIAAGLLLLIGGGVLLQHIIIRLPDKEGKTREIEVKPGKKLKIVHKPKPAPEAPANDPDRRAAEYVLLIGGVVQVNHQGREIRAVPDLPKEPFLLTRATLTAKDKVTDAGLTHFKGCKNLTILELNDTRVTDAGLAHFKDCKNLTGIGLAGSARITDAGLAHFKDFKKLTSLGLYNTQVTDAGLAYLKDCKTFQFLDLNSTRVTDAGLAHLKDCKNLDRFDLDYTPVNDAGLALLKNFKALNHLALTSAPITNAGLAHLKDCKNLKYLGLSGTPVTDAGLAHLEDCKNLTFLDVRQTKLSAKRIEQFHQAHPRCKIEHDGGTFQPTK